VLFLVAATTIYTVLTGRRRPPATGRGPGGAITIALAGDAAMAVPIDAHDDRLQATASILRGASVAFANFELSAVAAPPPATPADHRWPPAAPRAAEALRGLGVGVVSLANNHAIDYGVEGLRDTWRTLDSAGVAHAGTGENLEQARAATVVRTSDGTVAVIA